MTESSLNPNTPDSRTGAQGLFQFIPSTAREYGVDAHNAASSADGAARYLVDLHKRYGSWDLALQHYNGFDDPEYLNKVSGYMRAYRG